MTTNQSNRGAFARKLHVAFIDYKKAFDFLEHWTIMQSLAHDRIDSIYTELLKFIYENATLTVKLDEDLKIKPIKIKKGVRQGDTISPILFTLALEDVDPILA